ncbi:MFS general substrate transporter [Coprinellus micaceus]|uniref:MFS general substrate transporter n=1 Tax=Coprinellus micaceus TaxID=71717 RepID=A0A4Y7TZ43_COPMI|nr:MFS general substrate transporter [Coprinellus micaceus]
MATPADPLAVSGTLEPDSTRNSTLHGDESMLKEKLNAQVESVEGKPDIAARDDDFPDGGLRAWLVVGGAMCSTFATFGYVNSWGVFQAYYQTTVLSSIPPSNIAWIGSIQYSLVFLPSIFVGRLFDLGYFHSILVASSALLVAATFLIPHCTQYWQFILCQGFAVGLPCGCIFAPTASAVAHWFKKRRGLAMGFVAVGSSLGGTLLPIAAKQLLPQVGFKWTMRIIGFVLLAVLGSAILLMKRRLPGRKVAGGLFNWRAFRYAPFSVYCLSAFVTFQGVYAFLTYVAVSATEMGLPGDFAFYFVAFANAASLFGRYTAGPMNVMIPFTAAAGILTYAWPYANSKGSLIAVTLLYGFASGAYVSLVSNPAMDFGGPEDVGRRVGMFLSFLALGALAGPPISGAVRTATGGFDAVGCVGKSEGETLTGTAG